MSSYCACDFGELKDQLIRDKIVCGMQNNAVRRKLLQEPKLTLNRCLDICRAAEGTTAQIKAMTGQTGTTSEEINLLRKGKRRSAPVKRSTKSSTAKPEWVSDCHFCGKKHERQKNKCFTFGKVCGNCEKLSHFTEKCLAKTVSIKRKVHKVELEQDLSEASEEELLSVDLGDGYNLSVIAIKPVYQAKIFVTMEIEGKQVNMHVDSGVSCDVLPEKCVCDATEIKSANQTLLLYSKTSIPVTGTYKKLHFKNPKNTLTSGAGKFLGIPRKKLDKSWEFFPRICWDS